MTYNNRHFAVLQNIFYSGGYYMSIKSIKGLYKYLSKHSGFSSLTVRSVISSLGYNLHGNNKVFFHELSGNFSDCSKHGADSGFSGFIYYSDTNQFYKKHRQDIVSHMENSAAELGTDIISMVQNFGVFRRSEKPTASEIGKALWDSRNRSELTILYNVFAWYTLEEISHTWNRYLEEHPKLAQRLAA